MRTARVEMVPVRVLRPLPSMRIYKMNALWRKWKTIALLIGLPMMLTGLTTMILEMARAYSGVQNRGCAIEFVNGVSKRAPQYGYYPNSLLRVGLNEENPNYDPFGLNYPPVNYYMWPWSRPGMLFGLLLLVAGLLGVISAFRRTYSMIMAFLTTSLLSLLLLSYVIAYYSIAIHYYNKNFTCNGVINNVTYHKGLHFHDGKRLAAACLSFTILGVVLSFFALVLAALALELYRRKQSNMNARPPRPGPRGGRPSSGFYARSIIVR